MGTPALAVPTLEAVADRHEVVAVVTQPDRRSGRGREMVPSPVKRWALDAGVDVLQPESLREADAQAALARLGADVAVVVAFGQILPPEVLALPPLGCVNLHASLLPRHRGASPIQAAILSGDAATGVTTMLMDEGLDTGPVLKRREVPLRGDETAGSLGAELGRVGAELTVATLDELAAGTLRPEPQDSAAATMTRLIRKTDGEVDWQQDAAVIERRIRAMQPWPGAYTHIAGERLVLGSGRVCGETAAAPGTVLEAEDCLRVACGSGTSICIEELQRAGGRRMRAADMLRGHPVEPGSVAGTSLS